MLGLNDCVSHTGREGPVDFLETHIDKMTETCCEKMLYLNI